MFFKVFIVFFCQSLSFDCGYSGDEVVLLKPCAGVNCIYGPLSENTSSAEEVASLIAVITDGSGYMQTVSRGLLFLLGNTCFVSLLSLWMHMQHLATCLHVAAKV